MTNLASLLREYAKLHDVGTYEEDYPAGVGDNLRMAADDIERLDRIMKFAAMLRDPKQWVQNEWTKRVSEELDCILVLPDEPSTGKIGEALTKEPEASIVRDALRKLGSPDEPSDQ